MLIIVDQRIPEEAKRNLSAFGEVLEFFTTGITYEAISGHPDVFFCQTPQGLIAAPNTPGIFLERLKEHGVTFETGINPVGTVYPNTARYNAVFTAKYLIHNLSFTDPSLLSLTNGPGEHDESKFKIINVNQGYSRCNLLAFNQDTFLTSDHGIQKALSGAGLNVTYISPADTVLPGFKHGFTCGCCGIKDNNLFLIGNLNFCMDQDIIDSFVQENKLSLVELYNGPLFDGGGIFFL
jgi:hypothetical protein